MGGAGEAAGAFFLTVASFFPVAVALVFLPPSGLGPLGGGGVEESFGGPVEVFV